MGMSQLSIHLLQYEFLDWYNEILELKEAPEEWRNLP